MKNNYLVFIALAVVLTACTTSSNISYQSEKTKETDYSKYKTYAWLPTASDSGYTKILDKATVEKALAVNVSEQLNKRGMVLDTANPDCLFTYTLVMKKTYDVGQAPADVTNFQQYAPLYPNQANVYYYQPYYGTPTYSGKIAVTTFRDGSLVIDMVDRKDKKVIWRTSAEGRVREDQREGARATIKEIIPQMFKKFPVKK